MKRLILTMCLTIFVTCINAYGIEPIPFAVQPEEIDFPSNSKSEGMNKIKIFAKGIVSSCFKYERSIISVNDSTKTINISIWWDRDISNPPCDQSQSDQPWLKPYSIPLILEISEAGEYELNISGVRFPDIVKYLEIQSFTQPARFSDFYNRFTVTNPPRLKLITILP